MWLRVICFYLFREETGETNGLAAKSVSIFLAGFCLFFGFLHLVFVFFFATAPNMAAFNTDPIRKWNKCQKQVSVGSQNLRKENELKSLPLSSRDRKGCFSYEVKKDRKKVQMFGIISTSTKQGNLLIKQAEEGRHSKKKKVGIPESSPSSRWHSLRRTNVCISAKEGTYIVTVNPIYPDT